MAFFFCFFFFFFFCHCLFLIIPSFDDSGRLCFVIAPFPGYLHLHFVCGLYHENHLKFSVITKWLAQS